ncbi:MAG: TonB-dependent siderophore receptor [Rubrivivax sp.]
MRAVCFRHHRLALASLLALTQLPTWAQSAADTGTTSPLEVVGRRQGGAYEAGEVSGTKSSLPLRELPQSVRVIARQAIDDLGATRLDEVLDYVGGISRQNNFGGLWDNIAIRGLAGNENTGMAMLLNGFAGNRGFNAPRDTADLERVEFLKGPAAALYGASEPGGMVNLVTKQPLWRSAHALELYAGSHDSLRLALDSTGPLSETLAYRLNVALEDRDSFRDFVHSRRTVVAPALRWRLGADTTLNYNGQWLRHSTPLDRGVQAINGQLDAVPRQQFPGEPGDGDLTVDNQTHQLVLDQALGETWKLRAGLSWRGASLQGISTEPSSLRADNRTLWRQRRDRDYDSRDLALQAELQGQLRSGALVHELLFSTEAYSFRMDQRMLRINPSSTAPYALDLLAPVYGQTAPTPLPNTDTHETQRGLALTVQDALRLGSAWRLVAGVRLDRVEQSLDNRRNGQRTEQSPSEASPRLGLSYLANRQWTLFANAGSSFRPNTASTAGLALQPEQGQALEAGTKWEAADQRLGATLAVFNIEKRNIVTAGPGTGSDTIAAGRVRSRGLEADLAGQWTRHWRVSASLGYYDVAVLQDNTLAVGERLLNVPRVNGSLLAVYEDTLANGQRFGLGGGVTHMGARLGQAYTQAEANAGTAPFELPAYTTAKLTAYWRATPTLRWSLDVDNLFDTTHYTSSYSRLWVTPGAPRSFTLGVQVKL